jgi:hypothetical protein
MFQGAAPSPQGVAAAITAGRVLDERRRPTKKAADAA